MAEINSFRDLEVYQTAFERAMEVFELSKTFPREETYSLTDQIRRCSRSVCSNIAEAWRKRRYPAHFQSKLTDAQSEAEETRVWLQFASRCKYMKRQRAIELDADYDAIVGRLVTICHKAGDWTIKQR
jgi:four helix bundle protein